MEKLEPSFIDPNRAINGYSSEDEINYNLACIWQVLNEIKDALVHLASKEFGD